MVRAQAMAKMPDVAHQCIRQLQLQSSRVSLFLG
jgi:hypothetical protein